MIAPGALSEEAVTALVRDRLGEQAASEFCDACARATGGNPFLLGELLADLRRRVCPPMRRQRRATSTESARIG